MAGVFFLFFFCVFKDTKSEQTSGQKVPAGRWTLGLAPLVFWWTITYPSLPRFSPTRIVDSDRAPRQSLHRETAGDTLNGAGVPDSMLDFGSGDSAPNRGSMGHEPWENRGKVCLSVISMYWYPVCPQWCLAPVWAAYLHKP
ncbi:hypothetical protein LX36DRAFT_665808 [Colletotrichum falcatum]|nr:hypothetical protein LX36DRAFT_665808 [Colletotrichum falcatum]